VKKTCPGDDPWLFHWCFISEVISCLLGLLHLSRPPCCFFPYQLWTSFHFITDSKIMAFHVLWNIISIFPEIAIDYLKITTYSKKLNSWILLWRPYYFLGGLPINHSRVFFSANRAEGVRGVTSERKGAYFQTEDWAWDIGEGFHQGGYPTMDGLWWKIPFKWMIHDDDSIYFWLVVWNLNILYFSIVGISSSQLTFIFFRRIETTNQCWWYHKSCYVMYPCNIPMKWLVLSYNPSPIVHCCILEPSWFFVKTSVFIYIIHADWMYKQVHWYSV
jgi:hypothetical protein